MACMPFKTKRDKHAGHNFSPGLHRHSSSRCGHAFTGCESPGRLAQQAYSHHRALYSRRFYRSDGQTAAGGAAKALGQPIIVDNKPGANSLIGVDQLAKSAPDGYTFGVVIAAYAANTTLYPKLPYNPKKDLIGVSLMGISPLVAAVANNAPFKTTQELIAYAKAHPGKVSFGSSGSGSSAHLTTELMKLLTKTDMVHVPYKGLRRPDRSDGRADSAFLDPRRI